MSARRLFPLVLLLSVGLPMSSAFAQDRCTLLPGASAMNRVAGGGAETIYLRGRARFRCDGGISVEADSVIFESARDRLELIGGVVYEDSVKSLTADWLDYDRPARRLVARGDVLLTDRTSGSTLFAPELEHQDRAPGRAGSLTVVPSRSRAILRSDETPAQAAQAADSAGEPLVVDADRMEIFNREFVRAAGNVELQRGEMRGWSREATFDNATRGELRLIGDARVAGDAYDLAGDEIEATLASERLEEVTAVRRAVLLADDVRMDASFIRILFEDGELHRLVAGRVPDPDAVAQADADSTADADADAAVESDADAAAESDAGRRPVLRSREMRVIADSIDALAPARGLERLIAVGNAYGERGEAGPLGGDEAALPDLVTRDWVRGDTIIGYFDEDTSAVADAAGRPAGSVEPGADSVAAGSGARRESDARPVVLRRLVAIGGDADARSLYRISEEGAGGEPDGVNFLIARRITLFFRNGEVEEVEADGPVRGRYLRRPADAARSER